MPHSEHLTQPMPHSDHPIQHSPHYPTQLYTLTTPTNTTLWPPQPTLHSDHPTQHYTLTTPTNTTLWPPNQPMPHSEHLTQPMPHSDHPIQHSPHYPTQLYTLTTPTNTTLWPPHSTLHSDHPNQHYTLTPQPTHATLTNPTNPCHTLTTPPNTTLWPPQPTHATLWPPHPTLHSDHQPTHATLWPPHPTLHSDHPNQPMPHSDHPTQHYTLTTNQPMPHSDHPTRPMPHSGHPTQHYTLTTPPNTTLWPPQPTHATLWPPHPTLHSDHPIQHLPHFDPFTIQLPCSALTTPLTWGDECGICGATGQDAAQQAEQVVDDLIHARHIRGRIPVRQNRPQQLQGQDLKTDRRHSPNWTLFCFFFMRTTQPPCSFPPQFLVLLMLKLTVHLYVFIILRVTIKCSVRY